MGTRFSCKNEVKKNVLESSLISTFQGAMQLLTELRTLVSPLSAWLPGLLFISLKLLDLTFAGPQ